MPMDDVVEDAFARPAGGRRRIAVPFLIALAALAVAAPGASAGLPGVTDAVKVPVQLPLKDGAVGDLLPGDTVEGVVDDVVNEPLPEPVENVVQNSPVAPVRDEVRRVVNEATGGTGGGGGGGGSGSGSGGSGSSTGGTGSGSGGTGSGGSAGSGTGDRGTRTRNGSGRSTRGRGGAGPGGRARQGSALGLAGRITPGRGSTTSLSARGGSGKRAGTQRGREDGGASAAAIRTIRTVVSAVPTAIWIALGVLSLLALVLAGRTYVERRNVRALARDREQLLGDVAALERALLPAVPDQLGEVAISVAYRSCDGPAAGGDFYDAFELPGGRAAVIVGDISGHGPDALEGTNSLRAQLHALVETGMTPRAAIAMVGEHAPVQLAGRFSTVVVAVHDPADGTLTYAAAGHAPPIVVGPGAEELLGVGASPPVGVGLRTGVRETTVALPPGSTCCFYTDGLVEAKNGEGMIGRARLAELVTELARDEQADVLLDRVLAESSDAPDDMTVCVLRPVSGAQARSPRVEILELDADDVDSGFAARFLDVCGVPADDQDTLVEQARAAIDSSGLALLEITVDSGTARARVTSAPSAAAPPAAA
jgi:Stage II sporulation protein E (SpoIIE)